MYDGSQIRELDGSRSSSINGMDIRGQYFVTGGGDKVIKVILGACLADTVCEYMVLLL